jgi:membrane protease YdiL (CAAX protease family)
VVLSLAGASGQAAFHAPAVDLWSALGNAVSNLCEEIVFSGLVLLALLAVTGRRAVAVVLASLLAAAVHTQYPLELRALVAVNGALMASVRLWTGSLWTSWIAHQLSDMVIDAVLL